MNTPNLDGMVQKAIHDYNMIEDGDKIAIGVSGGKDSLALLRSLASYRQHAKISFEIYAITLDLGLATTDFSSTSKLCEDFNVPYFIEDTKIGHIIFDIRKEAKPCSLCANLRRGALNNKATAIGCNKVALGHNRDDVVETVAMSLFYEGRFHCFSPVTYLSRKNIHVIRPLIYAKSDEIREYCNLHNLQIVKSPCPATGLTNRSRTSEMLDNMSLSIPAVREQIFGALCRSNTADWKLPGEL